MADETVTGANDTSTVATTTADALTPPVNDGFRNIDPSVDNVSDIDGTPAKEGAEKSGDTPEAKAAAEKAAADKAAEDAAAKEKADLDRFDKHPRFQELNQKVKDLQEKLQAALTPKEEAAAKATAKADEAKGLPYKDITTMSKEELLEWQEDDPVGYAANLYQQIHHESREALKREAEEAEQQKANAQRTETVKATYQKYEAENPDFREMWDSGKIKEFMDANPGHNAISAHMAMTSEARIKAAVEKAAKETEARVIANFKAKRNAEVISDGGTVKESGIPDELKNPDKYGGTTQALAARLERMRQAAAGG